MNILITGGTGLIGRAFISQFDDYQYTVLTRSPAKARKYFSDKTVLIDSLDHLRSLDTFDAVINLAGEPIIDKRWSDNQKLVLCQSRWHITRQLSDLFANSMKPPAVFLSGSAIGVYGNRQDEPLTESAQIENSDFPSELCSHWESTAKLASPYTRVVFLRTGIVLSRQGGALGKMLLPFKLGLGGRVADGQQYMSWIHILDYVNALNFLLVNENISSSVNLVAPKPENNAMFTKTLASVLHRPAVFPLPGQLLKLLMGESSCLLTEGQRVMPEVLQRAGFEFRYPDLKMALEDLL